MVIFRALATVVLWKCVGLRWIKCIALARCRLLIAVISRSIVVIITVYCFFLSCCPLFFVLGDCGDGMSRAIRSGITANVVCIVFSRHGG